MWRLSSVWSCVAALFFAGTVGLSNDKPLAFTSDYGHDLFAISPDGKQLALYGSGVFKIADTATGKILRTDDRNSPSIFQMTWFADGKRILAVGEELQIETAKSNATSGDEKHSLSTDGAPVQQVSFSPNGRWLAAAVDTEPVAQVYVWHADTLEPYVKLPAGSGALLDAHFRDDNKLVYRHSKGEIIVWEAGRQRELRRFPVDDVDGDFGFSRGRNVKLAIGSVRGEILIAGAKNGETVIRFQAHSEAIRSVDISSDGKLVVSGSHDQTARIWDVATGKQLDLLPKLPGLRMTFHAVQFSPDDKFVAAGNERAVLVWDVKQRKLLHQLSGHDGYCRCLDFSADSKWLVTGGDDRRIRIWRIADGKQVAELSGHTDMLTGVSLATDQKTLASCSFDKTVKIWDVSKFLGSEKDNDK